MRNAIRSWVFYPLLLLISSCSAILPDPVRLDSLDGMLDLRVWNFASGGPVAPGGWVWDADVLWSPGTGGRPLGLPAPAPLGPPDQGGSLTGSLQSQWSQGGLAVATAQLTLLVADGTSYGLQIGALPGAYEVWVNSDLVWKSGVPSSNRGLFRADGAGTVVTVHPLEGRLDLVVPMATTDLLVRHFELNRRWLVGPAQPMLLAERSEHDGRVLQATFLLMTSLVFLGLAFLRPNRNTFFPFFAFLVLCLAKLLVNVEQAEPLLASWLPGVSPSVYLFLNHGLNLLPFPLMVLFMVRQFPLDVSLLSFLVISGATLMATLWELLPFLLLAFGAVSAYELVMKTPWALVLNVYVVLVTLYIFERFYHVAVKKRPLAQALFFGGMGIGLIILMPIPLGYFLPVKYTLFMGWGLFVFLLILGFELIRLEVRDGEAEIRLLSERLTQKETLGRLVSRGWGVRLGRESLESLQVGDHATQETVFVQISSPDASTHWLPLVGEVAEARQGLLVEWREGEGLWVLDTWAETSLAFALEVQRKFTSLQGLRYRMVLTRASVAFRVVAAGTTWLPTVEGVPRARLTELGAQAEKYGAPMVVDVSLLDGLVIGGWRRHRHLTPAGTEIELYEGEEESLATIKDSTLEAYESALSQARSGHHDRAIQEMVTVVRKNPFDQPARAHLAEWGR